MPSCLTPLGGSLRSLQKRVVSYPSQPDTASIARPRVIAPRLPPELLIIIFNGLIPPIHVDAFLYRISYPAFSNGENTVSTPDPGLKTILSVTRVCQAWRAVGTSILYSRPFLISNHNLKRFCRTIQNNPDIGALVKHLYILDQDESLYPPPLLSRWVGPWERARVRSALIETLRLCFNIESITITNRYWKVSTILPIDDSLVYPSLINDRLRRLTVYGSTIPSGADDPHFLSSTLSFSSLVFLCLRETSFKVDFVLPTFPKLHTLQIAQCTDFPGGGILDLYRGVLPSLRVLHVIENTFEVTISADLMAQLQDVFYLHFGQEHVPPPWSISSTPLSLRQLALPFEDIACPSFDSCLPSNLENLTLLWTGDNALRPDEVFETLVEKLRTILLRPTRTIQSVTVLRQVGTSTVALERSLIGLRMSCELRKIKHEVHVLWLDNWIRDVLSPL